MITAIKVTKRREDLEESDSDNDSDGNTPTKMQQEKGKKVVKNPGSGKRPKVPCPQCGNLLSKAKFNLEYHYKVKHKMVPIHEMNEEIAKATK